MRLVVVVVVLVIVLSCVVGLEASPSARHETEARRVKRDLHAFDRALFENDKKNFKNKRGFFSKIKKKAKGFLKKHHNQIIQSASQYAITSALGKRGLGGFR